MYTEIERRRQPQKWASRATLPGKSQTVAAAGMQRRAEERAQGAKAGVSPGSDEARHLRERLQALTEANSELEAFNATVSHDLCTPLTTINGYCQVLTEICGGQLDEHAKEYLQGIYQCLCGFISYISCVK